MTIETKSLVERARLTYDERMATMPISSTSIGVYLNRVSNAQLAKALWAVVDDLEASNSQDLLDYCLTLKVELIRAGLERTE